MLRENRNHWLDHPALSLQWCMCSGRPENAVWAHKGHNRRRCQLVPQRLHQEPKCRIPSTAGITIHYRRVLSSPDIHCTYIIAGTTEGGLSDEFYFLRVFSPLRELHFICSFKRNDNLSLEVVDQSQRRSCLVASGHCLPSAADEGWHSAKRPYSTVAVQQFVIFTAVNILFVVKFISC